MPADGLPPGPPRGSILALASWLYRPYEFFDECASRYGETFTLRPPGSAPVVVFSTPEAIRDVYAGAPELMRSGEFNRDFRHFLGEWSLLGLDGEAHARHRRLIAPAFRAEQAGVHAGWIAEVTNAAVDGWRTGVPFSAYGALQAITLRVVLGAVLGVAGGERFERAVALVTRVVELGANPLHMLPWFRIDLGPLTPWGRFRRMRRTGDRMLAELLRERRAGGRGAGAADLLTALANGDHGGEALTDAEICDEVVTLVVAGHETTATAITWALRWILADPSVLDRLLAELDALGGEPTAEAIARLPLLDSVVREALRLQPVVPAPGRILGAPARIGGLDLPAGAAVMCSVYLAGRREAAFPDAARFVADRFVTARPSPGEWFPFGGGARRCVGMPFALLEMKLVLSILLRRARLALACGPEIRAVRRGITVAPDRGLPVVLEGLR